MRTRLTIMVIVLAAATAAIGVIVVLVIALGWLGLAVAALGTLAVLAAYRRWIQPWQHRWGASDEEVRRALPGDDLLSDAASTTRAITIAAPAEQVWPWLVQIGYGRGGWYSYDWIEPNRFFVAGDQEAGVWCLALYPASRGCRLISRWRVNWPLTPATAIWVLLSDPGAAG
jgi:hypothetical protein